MFWRFGGFANISSIDNILDKADVTLEELLDENDVIQELKAQNAKLIEFLRDEAALAKLLKYVVAPKLPEPQRKPETPEAERNTRPGFFSKSRSKARSESASVDEDAEQQEAKRSKYAFVACEILSSEVWSISESLLESPDHLRDFWDYIKQDIPLDNRTAGYFTKVNEALLEKKSAEMVAFIKSLDNVVVNLMKHVDCPVMMDLLLKLISLEKEPPTQGVVDWLQSQHLIPIFLSYITPEHPASTQTAAGDFLKAIITISANATGQDASVIGPNELTRQLVSDECISNLLSEMLKGGNPLTVGVGIIIEVIRKNNSDYDTEGQVGPEPKSSDPIYLGTLLRMFANHVPKFMELILSRNHTVVTEKGSEVVERKKLGVAWGEKIEPLGFDRFKTCELMAELLHCSNMGLLNEKGSEVEMKRRDAERQRLKSEGNLAAEHPHRSSTDFGTSVDSSGFHHAQAFSPLGESPEDIRALEVQNSGEDEEEFEKVAVSEAMPDAPAAGDQESLGVSAKARDKASPLADKVGDIELDTDAVMTDTPSSGSEQDEQKAKTQVKPSSTDKASENQNDDDKPAPLFSKRTAEQSSDSGPGSTPETSSDEGKSLDPQASKPEDSQSTPINEGGEQHPPDVQREEDGSPVVGDLLKMMFVEHHVVPTILDFFFRFPWNNFLHNVVYDVVQQVFNGSMDRGFNRSLAIDLFETGRVTNRVIEGQQRSDKSQEECKRRLGYMGHLTLIAEEVVKFTERQPPELLAQLVVDKIMDPEWIQYVEQTLTETRDRDNAILGGVRPDHSVGPRQAVLNAVNASQGGFGGSSALANAGLGGNVSGGLDSMDLASAGAAGYGLNSSAALLSGFGGSDDEEDEEMEDGDLGGDSTLESQQRRNIDDDDQSSQAIMIPPQQPSSDPPPIPAPLAIPPSRARRQLAARLAEKQRAATSSDNDADLNESSSSRSSDQAELNTPSSSSTGSLGRGPTAGSRIGAPGAVRMPQRLGSQANTGHDDEFPDLESSEDGEDEDGEGGGNGFADDFTGFAESESTGTGTGTEGEGEGATDEDEEDDDSADDAGPPRLARQTTREAVQRRPLDVDDDSDDDDEDIQLPPPLQPPQSRMSANAAAEAKKREQDRLLRRWGFDDEDVGGGPSSSSAAAGMASAAAAGRPNTDTDTDEDDDDDDDDEPVLMGSKYTARRRTGS